VPGVDEPVPKTIGEARKSRYWEGFKQAIDSEMRQLEKNNTWEYVDRGKVPRGCNLVTGSVDVVVLFFKIQISFNLYTNDQRGKFSAKDNSVLYTFHKTRDNYLV